MNRAEDDTLPSPGAPPPRNGEDKTLPLGTPRNEQVTMVQSPQDIAAQAQAMISESAISKPRSSAPRSPKGARVGDYVIGDLLAEGGFGVVYRAVHAKDGAPVAVKILHAELVSHPEAILRFEREVEVIERIQHPNVIHVFGYGRLDDGRPYFAMELLSGVSLEHYLERRGRLAPSEVIRILKPLCSALETAHAQSIVHRDIKPSNVFLCGEGEEQRVVLLDFGVAKLLDASGPALTSSRHIVGTMACIAPEQLLGKPIDPRTDIYALGVLTYTMLVGEPPFSDGAYPLLRQLHLYASPPRPSTRVRVSTALDNVVVRAMSKEASERPPTAAAFLAEVQAAVSFSPGSGQLERGAKKQKALGVYVDVRIDPDALDNPDDRLLEDVESILPFVTAQLSNLGFVSAVEAGTSMLATVDRPDDPDSDASLRRNSLQAILSLMAQLENRPDRDLRVSIHFLFNAGGLVVSQEGELVGGDLLELARWVPHEVNEKLLVSQQVLNGLELNIAEWEMNHEWAVMTG